MREDLWATEWERWRRRREGSESLGGVWEAPSLESKLFLSALPHPVASIRSLALPQQLPEKCSEAPSGVPRSRVRHMEGPTGGRTGHHTMGSRQAHLGL